MSRRAPGRWECALFLATDSESCFRRVGRAIQQMVVQLGVNAMVEHGCLSLAVGIRDEHLEHCYAQFGIGLLEQELAARPPSR